MKLPKRASTHIAESSSLTMLRQKLPPEWIVREQTERDYGVDLYIELVGRDQMLSGNLATFQLKAKCKIVFKDGRSIVGGIKRETLNYLLQLPVPAFVVVACLGGKKCYWANIREQNRRGRFQGNSKTISVQLDESLDFSEVGITALWSSYFLERGWPEIENAIEKSLMLFNTLGPLVLMCKRGKDDSVCSTTIQYLINQHYGYYMLLSPYILGKKPIDLPHWYIQNLAYIKSEKLESSVTLHFKTLKEMIRAFVSDYRDSIIAAYTMVTETHAFYFSERLPYLYMHLKDRPHTFVQDDWYARFYFDEYENETQNPQELYFKDFEEFDGVLHDLTLT